MKTTAPIAVPTIITITPKVTLDPALRTEAAIRRRSLDAEECSNEADLFLEHYKILTQISAIQILEFAALAHETIGTSEDKNI